VAQASVLSQMPPRGRLALIDSAALQLSLRKTRSTNEIQLLDRQKLIHDYSSQVSIGGLPGAIRQLQAIARVALRGLRPLIEAIENG
jgi:hypothetical protein